MQLDKISRRTFVKTAALAGVSSFAWPAHQAFSDNKLQELSIHIFSKHLQFLDYEAVGQKAREMGFDGVDLTVRPGGHVQPQNVQVDLLRAVSAIEAAGSRCSLMTTAVEGVQKTQDMEVLEVAASQGIKYYRTNWYRYQDQEPMQKTLEKYARQITELSRVNKELGLVGCYQNHAGTMVGASLWEVAALIENAESENFGVQYDIRHATVEGGLSWPNGLRRIHTAVKTIVLKDFMWARVKGKWRAVSTPIGEGMVDFLAYFKLLKKYNIRVPVSLHLEYPLGGAEHGKRQITVDQSRVYEAMKKDLNTVRELWKKA